MIEYFLILIGAFTILLVFGFWVTAPEPYIENLKNKDEYKIYVLDLKDGTYDFDFDKENVSIFPFTSKLGLGYKSKSLKKFKFKQINNNFEFSNGKDIYTIKTNKDEDYPVRILVGDYDYYINIKKSDKKHKQNNIQSFDVKFNKVNIAEIEETKENNTTTKIRLRTKDKKINLQLLTAIFSGFLIEEMKNQQNNINLDDEPFQEKKFDKV